MTANQFHLAGKASSFLRKYPELVGGSVVLVGLYLTSLYRYVLFHSLAEVFSIVVACGVFMVYWNSRRFLSNDYFLFVGIAYLCVGCLDLLHTLAYKGMGVFPTNDGNLANQLWIAGVAKKAVAGVVAGYRSSHALVIRSHKPAHATPALTAAHARCPSRGWSPRGRDVDLLV